MGKRLLKEWVGRPLVVKERLEERVGAIEELLEDQSGRVAALKGLLKGMPDLMRGLVRITSSRVGGYLSPQSRLASWTERSPKLVVMLQSNPSELITVLLAFKRIATFSEKNPIDGYRSSLLSSILTSFPTLLDPVENLLSAINEQKVCLGSNQPRR